MAILVTTGRAALAFALMQQPFYLAWGSGDPDWDLLSEPPIPNMDKTALINETGRHLLSIASFCVPDVNGSIDVPTGRYSQTNEMSNNIYLNFRFDFADGAGLTIRELGVFSGGSVVSGLPPGQLYFTPDQVATSGTLVLLDQVIAFPKSPNVRPTFDFVLTV